MVCRRAHPLDVAGLDRHLPPLRSRGARSDGAAGGGTDGGGRRGLSPLTGTVPEFGLPFLRSAMILRGTCDRAGAAEAMLQVAWSADDAADSINGARWRAEAAFL
jgi:hypothetical protein